MSSKQTLAMESEQLFPFGIFWFEAKGLVKEINGPKPVVLL